MGMVAFAQSNVGALGKSSDAAQKVFDRGLPEVTDTIWDLAAVQEQPEFPGGNDAMYRYIADSIIYPEEELSNKISGKVYVEFVVRKDGHVDGVKVRRGAPAAFNAEAVRAIRAMPTWKAGMIDGKPVDTRFVMPINFVAD